MCIRDSAQILTVDGQQIVLGDEAQVEQQSLDAEYDQGVTRKAIDSYSDFIALYPNEEKVAAAPEQIKAMKVEQARGSIKIAP